MKLDIEATKVRAPIERPARSSTAIAAASSYQSLTSFVEQACRFDAETDRLMDSVAWHPAACTVDPDRGHRQAHPSPHVGLPALPLAPSAGSS